MAAAVAGAAARIFERDANLPYAPFDLRRYGVEVDPQLAVFSSRQVILGVIMIFQCALVTAYIYYPPNRSYVRKQVRGLRLPRCL